MAGLILRPFLRQVEAPLDRQAPAVAGQGQADRDLAILGLAQLAAALARHPDRVRTLFGQAAIVNVFKTPNWHPLQDHNKWR